MYRVQHYKISDALKVRLVSTIMSVILLPFLLSHLETVDSVYIPFCQAQSQDNVSSPLAGAKEPAWREIGPWEQMVWISEMAPRRGALITEDATMKLLRELANVGTILERREFLRQELHTGVVGELSSSNPELRRMVADVFVLGAIDALEKGEYIQADSFLQGSKLLLPGLESQSVVEKEIRKYWQPDEESEPLFSVSWLEFGLYIVAGGLLFYFLFGQSSSKSRISIYNPKPANTLEEKIQVSGATDNKEHSRDFSNPGNVVPIKAASTKTVGAVSATEAEGLARTDVGYLTRDVEVQRVQGDLDDVFSDPDAAVADMIGFDFAVGSHRNND